MAIVYEPSHKHDRFVQLTDSEINEAARFGGEMYDHSQKSGFKDYRPEVRNGVDGRRVQQLGSVVERAVAKALGIPWTKWMDTFRSPDLHHNIECRLIGDERYGLRVKPHDEDSRRVVGVVIPKGRERGHPYRIPGWINAKFGKREAYLIDPHDMKRPIYAVPQARLWSLDRLERLIAAEKIRDQTIEEWLADYERREPDE